MQTITATFSNGKTITRKTVKALTHAWYAENIYQDHTGFASSAEAAAKAARSSFNGGCPKAHTVEVVAVTVA